MAAPYRPEPPPSQGFLNDLFPVNPLEVAGGLYGLGTEAIGKGVGYAAGHPVWGVGSEPNVANTDLLGRDVTAMLDSPAHHVGPSAVAAVPVVAAGAKLLPEVKAGESVASTLAKRAALAIRSSPDDPYDVARSSFDFSKFAGNRTMPLTKLFGGVALDDPAEVARVNALVNQMQSPGGYIARLVVDNQGNVLEGQHRLEALRQIGQTSAPVSVVNDLSTGYDVGRIKDAMATAGPLHPDYVNGVLGHAFNAVADTGSPQAALNQYELPPPFNDHFRAALSSMAEQGQ